MRIATDMAGRPPKGTKPYRVHLFPRQVEAIDNLTGTYERSDFIREAVERELQRREKGED